MPFSINPELIENNDVEIQTVDGELALFHKPSGNTLIIDEDTTVSEKLQSPLRDNVDLDGNDLISGGSGEFTALEAGSVNTEKATINNHPSEEHKNQLLYGAETGEDIEFTATDIELSTDQTLVIKVNYLDDEDNANNEVHMGISGMGDGRYNYTLEDDDLSAISESGEDQYVLIRPTASNSSDGQSGRWFFQTDEIGRPMLWGRGSSSIRSSGFQLAKGFADTPNPLDDPFDLTISASASAGEVVRLEVSVKIENGWGDI